MVARARGGSAWEDKRERPPVGCMVDVSDHLPVAAEPSAVFERLLNMENVVRLLPGLQPGSLRQVEAGKYEVVIKKTVLGVAALWDMRILQEADPEMRRVTLLLDGEDKRLGLTLTGNATIDVGGEGDSTNLEYTGHVQVLGRLAAAGGPIMRKLIEEILQRFMCSLSADGDDAAGRPSEKMSFLGRLLRLFRKPGAAEPSSKSGSGG